MKQTMKSYPATVCCLSALFAIAVSSAPAADTKKAWTDPAVARQEDPDFSIQGEYGSAQPGAASGVQVVALGEGKFDAYVLQGGLPGLGWERGKERVVLNGSRSDKGVALASADGKVSAVIRDGKLDLTRQGEKVLTLPRIERTSPTMGAKPPAGAVVLFDGSSADQWENGKMENGLLAANNCRSKPKFKSHAIHLEFLSPYMPYARGQGRGNSGIYYGGRWETQVLDSFGLAGAQNECGGIYSISEPRLNMCLPPLAWQTYDVEFTAAKFAADGQPTAWPRITVKHNGVLIHENLELPKSHTTAAPIGTPLKDEEGPVFIQFHGNPVFFRNIWVMPVK
jgi:hypothetical protein